MTIGQGAPYWQRCAECSEQWIGTHVCRKSAIGQITGEMIRDGEKAVREGRFATLDQIKTELKLREEVEQLRAERDALKAKLAALVELSDAAVKSYANDGGPIIVAMELLGRELDAIAAARGGAS